MDQVPPQTTGSKLLLVLICIGFIASVLGIVYLSYIWPGLQKKSTGHVVMIGNTFIGTGYYIEPDRINIMAFGAKGDGITYDDEAYKAALKEVERRGLPLYFPTAHYPFHQLYFADCDGAELHFENSLIDLDGDYQPFIIQPQHPIRNLLIKGMQIRPVQ